MLATRHTPNSHDVTAGLDVIDASVARASALIRQLLLSALEGASAGIPLLLMTGYTGEDISELSSDRCRHQLLRKPFAQAQLMSALEALLSAAAERANTQSA